MQKPFDFEQFRGGRPALTKSGTKFHYVGPHPALAGMIVAAADGSEQSIVITRAGEGVRPLVSMAPRLVDLEVVVLRHADGSMYALAVLSDDPVGIVTREGDTVVGHVKTTAEVDD